MKLLTDTASRLRRWLAASPARRAAATLSLATTLTLLLLALADALTHQPIATAQARHREQLINAVLPSLPLPLLVDNDKPVPLDDSSVMQGVRGADDAQAWLIDTTTHEGYNGDIRLLIGLLPGSELQPAIIDGVRVLSHHETPGLGDPIERERSDWIEQFRGRRIAELATAWSSGRTEDGFDALTGASITSMAVLNAVQRAGHDAARHVLEESNDVQDSDGPEDPSGVEVLRGQ